MKKVTLKGLWQVLKDSFAGFAEDKIPKLSGSLAYYTVFSLAPLMIVIIFLAGLILGQEAAQGTIYNQIEGFVGHDTAVQLQDMIKNASISDKGTTAAIIGVITLLIGATTVFAEIQDSINTIWGLKAKPKSGILKIIKDRLLSFGIIGSLGFLLLVSLGVTAIVEGIGSRLQNVFPDVAVTVFYIVNLVLSFLVVTGLFAVIFKVLPDAKIQWKDVLGGAIATALLFMIGKFGISLYISKSEIGSTYGAAGSLVVLLVWVYYSAIILYFGAEFTKAYAMRFGSKIQPTEYAVLIRKIEVEEGQGAMQEASANAGRNGAHQQNRQHQNQVPHQMRKTPVGPQPAYIAAAAQEEPKEEWKSMGFDPDKGKGMLDLVGAFALAALFKIRDYGKQE